MHIQRYQTKPATDHYMGPVARGKSTIIHMTGQQAKDQLVWYRARYKPTKGVCCTGHWPTNMTQGLPFREYIWETVPLGGTTNMAQRAARESQKKLGRQILCDWGS